MLIHHDTPRRNAAYAANGFMVINDSHLDDTAPSTRVDDYSNATLSKFHAAVQFCNENKLILCVAGDVLGHSSLKSDAYKLKITRIIGMSAYPILTIPGNHDMSASMLSERDTLWLLAELTNMDVLRESGVIDVIELHTDHGIRLVGVGGTPYGQELPKEGVNWGVDVSLGLWLSHHNLPFSSHYKRQQTSAFIQIPGVDIVMNGHLHHAAPSVKAGETTYYNNGSIARTKSNERERVPCGTVILPDGTMEIITFDMDGGRNAFSSAAGRASAPTEFGSTPEEGPSVLENRNRFTTFLAQGQTEGETVGQLLDEALSTNEITQDMRQWLEGVSDEATSRIGAL